MQIKAILFDIDGSIPFPELCSQLLFPKMAY